ncbi:kinetochore protein NDC80 homolog [Diospyros lotus]|uniref:kinetochore protein NDC80 homolog n=1 Tax=Diospyros lotus TaxID=55363 RepID=UPI0022559025|nr:kinetochore protein NDC80 homolog [Diospyros lotus]
MRAPGAGRRRPKESFVPDWKPPATPTADPWQFTGATGRDSDASFCSSRPSSAGINRSGSGGASVPMTDRGYQICAIRTVNSYLASHSVQFSLKPPLPSAKDITETLKFVLARLEFPSNKLEEDLYVVLKHLNCPIKLNKSALRAPGTPHSWPNLLAVIHWLVQIAMYNDHLNESEQVPSIFEDNSMFMYATNSYLHFIQGDDDSVEMLDREFMEKVQAERDSVEENVKSVVANVKDLEAKLESMRSEPSARELLEEKKSVLEEDVKKFHAMIEQLKGHIVTIEKVLEEKEKELEAKVGEDKKICEENDDLRKRIELQGINSRDAERMKRELHAVERDIAEAELARNTWEEKSWDLDATIGHKFKELEALSIECNQAIKRLKLGNGFQYELNAKGSTPAEILGINYKSTLKPALTSFADDIKKSSMEKLEELISLQQISVDISAKIEAKRNHIAAVQSRVDELEAQLNSVKRETQEYTSRCLEEAKKMIEEIEADAHKLDIVEREAAEFLKSAELKLQEATVQDEEETQLCARELFALVDSVSKYKEYVASKISEMKSALSETAVSVSNLYKDSLTAQFGLI